MTKRITGEPGPVDRLELHRRLKAIINGGYTGLLSAPALVVLNHVAVHAGFADCRVSIGAKAVSTLTGTHRTSIRRGIDDLLEVGIIRRRKQATARRAAVAEGRVPPVRTFDEGRPGKISMSKLHAPHTNPQTSDVDTFQVPRSQSGSALAGSAGLH